MVRLLVVLGLLVATAAHADITGSIGVGAVGGRMVWEGPPAPGFEHPGDLRLTDTFISPAVSVGGFVGQRLTTAVALGVALDATGTFLTGPTLGQTKYNPGGELDMLVRVVIRRSFPGMVWRIAAGGTFAVFGTSRSDVATVDNVAKYELLAGPLVEFSGGYNYARNRQLAVSLRAGYLVSQHMQYIPVILSLRWHFGQY